MSRHVEAGQSAEQLLAVVAVAPVRDATSYEMAVARLGIELVPVVVLVPVARKGAFGGFAVGPAVVAVVAEHVQAPLAT